MTYNCIVIEDEPLAMERMVSYIEQVPVLTLAKTFERAPSAIEYLKSNSIQLIFLDINLGEVSGIQLLETVNIDCPVIITTAYPDYALKGYELNVTDYLLKPFSYDRFLQAVNKVQQLAVIKETNTPANFIFVKTENRVEKIFLDDILFIEGKRDYRRIHTLHKKIMTLQTFTDFEKTFATNVICRVHKSYMVAINKIETVAKGHIYIQTKSIPVSETYKQQLFQILGK